MKRLPLYNDYGLLPQQFAPVERSHDCTQCRLSEKTEGTKCMSMVGEVGGILVILDTPSKEESKAGISFLSRNHRYFIKTLKDVYDGPVAFDYAIKCPTFFRNGKMVVMPNSGEKCTPFTMRAVELVQPTRIILAGRHANRQFFGESVDPFSVRGSVAWFADKQTGEHTIPVFPVLPPAETISNMFYHEWLVEQLKWATTTPLDELPKPPHQAAVDVAETVDEVVGLIDECLDAEGVSLDIETSGRLGDNYMEIECLCLTPYGTETTYGIDKELMKLQPVRDKVRDLLEDGFVRKCGQGARFDIRMLEAYVNGRSAGCVDDTLLMRKALWATHLGGLSTQAYLVGMGGIKQEMHRALKIAIKRIEKAREAKEETGGQQTEMVFEQLSEAEEQAVLHPDAEPEAFAYGCVDRELMIRYCALDTLTTERLRVLNSELVAQVPCVSHAYETVISRTVEPVAQMERWGMPVNRESVEDFGDVLSDEVEELSARLNSLGVSNPNSQVQVSQLMFTTLGLTPTKFTAAEKPSTDKASLELLRARNFKNTEATYAIETLLEHRKYAKLLSSYYHSFKTYITDDGRIHPNFNVEGASTGRSSVRDPALQTLPKAKSGTDKQRRIVKMARHMFDAGDGRKIIQLDYSTLEVRVAAMLSGDPVMREMLDSGLDFHLSTAKMIAEQFFHCKPEEVDGGMRDITKAFNFGLIYGMKDGTLAERIGSSVPEAAALRSSILGKWYVLDDYTNACIEEAKDTGWTYTWWAGKLARRRPLHDIAYVGRGATGRANVSKATNGALNSRVQGTASDFLIASLIKCVRWLQDNPWIDCKLIMGVHDSLMFDCADEFVDMVALYAYQAMRSHDSQGIDLPVDIEVGQTWATLDKYFKHRETA